jgi:uncharacterized protein YndB with AHSA1/START domain
MGTLTVTRTIDAPREVVFDVLTNAARYPEYTPIRWVEREQAGSEAPDGVGAIRALHVAGPPLRERVLAYEPPRRFSFEVLSGAPLRHYEGDQTLVEEDGGTRVSYRVELTPLVPGSGLAAAAAVRGLIEVLMRLAGPEARRRLEMGRRRGP